MSDQLRKEQTYVCIPWPIHYLSFGRLATFLTIKLYDGPCYNHIPSLNINHTQSTKVDCHLTMSTDCPLMSKKKLLAYKVKFVQISTSKTLSIPF